MAHPELQGGETPGTQTWAAMTPAEEKLYKYLARKHRLIRLHGAKAEELIAADEAKKERRDEWVRKNGLSCFKCGTRFGEWVAGGKRANGSLWVACKCIWRKERS